MKKSVFAVLAVFLLAVLFVGGVSAEKVIAGVDDLAGAKIGVQLELLVTPMQQPMKVMKPELPLLRTTKVLMQFRH